MKKLVLFAALIVFVSNTMLAQETEAVVKEVPVPAGYAKQIDVVYKEVGEWKGRVDIYYQPGKLSKAAPVVINMHGGAWRHGSKEAQGGFATYFKLGFAVANVEYRLSSQGNAPAAIEDVRCAMLYLVNHADSLNIDVNRIIFCGSSAGAHLALMAGLMGSSNTQFDKDCVPASKKYSIAAIIAQSAPSILFETTGNGQLKVLKDGAIYEWFGSKRDDAKFAQQLSPVTYVARNNPPIFLSHGNADPRVPYQQSVLFDAALTAAGVKHVFVTIDGGGHGGYTKDRQNEIKQQITDFLNEQVINKQ